MFGHFINPEWHDFYSNNQHLIQHDIMARHLFVSGVPHFVDVRRPETFPATSMTKDEAGFVQLAVEFGMRQTLSMSYFNGRTARQSILMLNQTACGSGDLSELCRNHLPEFYLAAQYFVEGLHIQELAREAPLGRLSDRERDCLSWAATGRTTKEIADILHLADDTVNEYFTSAMRKLGAGNRTQAVVRAYVLNQIAP
ncbi:LuxR C-terminal-related transcriptional regulator [Sulfitobacter aestuariivivens]